MFNCEEIKNLNELELSLYEYIMKNSEKVMYMKIRDLANEAHISTTTVLRFCRKLNCDGFSEFKLKFKMYMEDKEDRKVNEDASFIIDNFKRLSSNEFKGKIDGLCQLIREHDNIVFLGGGLSGIVGKYGSRYLTSIGKFCIYIDDLYYPINCENFKKGLVIALSESGETVEIIRVCSANPRFFIIIIFIKYKLKNEI